MVAVGLGGLVLLTNPPFWKLFGDARFHWFPGIGTYPKSLLGTDVERGVERLSADRVLPARRDLDDRRRHAAATVRSQRWLQRRRPWKATIAVNA